MTPHDDSVWVITTLSRHSHDVVTRFHYNSWQLRQHIVVVMLSRGLVMTLPYWFSHDTLMTASRCVMTVVISAHNANWHELSWVLVGLSWGVMGCHELSRGAVYADSKKLNGFGHISEFARCVFMCLPTFLVLKIFWNDGDHSAKAGSNLYGITDPTVPK